MNTTRRKLLLAIFVAACCTALGLVGTARADAVPSALTDAEVLGIYIQVNGFDVETALLGRAQASANAVREMAAHVSSDHQGVRQAAFDLAATCKVSPVLPGSRVPAAVEHARTMANLTALTGAEFDKAYLRHEVAFHRAAIDAVRQVLLPSATCPALRAHFTNVLPAFERHVSETEALARGLTAR